MTRLNLSIEQERTLVTTINEPIEDPQDDSQYLEDPEVAATYDPSIWDQNEWSEYHEELYGDDEVLLLSLHEQLDEDDVPSMNLSDHIDWDSMDYEVDS